MLHTSEHTAGLLKGGMIAGMTLRGIDRTVSPISGIAGVVAELRSQEQATQKPNCFVSGWYRSFNDTSGRVQ